jgi:pimeloyl-ACP methyl ester carboxylesterase
VSLANTLARARFLVLVPEIPSLRALRVRAADARVVADAFAHLLNRPQLPDASRAGIGAFSYAVGPAVLAALAPNIRDRVDFVFGVGGYHDLHRVVSFFTTGYYRQDGRWQYLQPNRYGKWVFVLGNVERLSDPHDRQALRRIAEYQLEDPAADVDHLRTRLTAEGRVVLALLENQDPAHTPALIAGLPAAIRTELNALNLANKDLSRLHARLILLHGPDDAIIPYTESIALAAAVPAGRSRLFIIDGLAHVDVRPFGIDRGAMRRAIDALLAERDRQ